MRLASHTTRGVFSGCGPAVTEKMIQAGVKAYYENSGWAWENRKLAAGAGKTQVANIFERWCELFLWQCRLAPTGSDKPPLIAVVLEPLLNFRICCQTIGEPTDPALCSFASFT
jgi:hypothetical protein